MDEIVVGVDIGTSKVCTLIGRVNKANQLEILGKGIDYCSGVKKGIIVDIESTAGSIRNSLHQAETEANMKISSAHLNIMGAHVSVISNKSLISISNDNREITAKDVEKALYSVRNIPIPEDRQIIDVVTKQYIIDGYDEILDPVGMVGTKLEVDADIIAGKITSVQNIIKSVEKANIRIDGLVVEALATGEIALTPDERDLGVILIDVGGGITDVSVFKKKNLVFYDSIPVGGDHISNDISIGLKIPYFEADKIKKEYELALTSLINNDQDVQVSDINEGTKKTVKVSEVVEIIEARVNEIFLLCRDALVKSGLHESLNAGVVLTGGGVSYVDGAKQIASDIFELPVRVASYRSLGINKPEYATAAGIVRFIATHHKGGSQGSQVRAQKPKSTKKGESSISKILKFFSEFF